MGTDRERSQDMFKKKKKREVQNICNIPVNNRSCYVLFYLPAEKITNLGHRILQTLLKVQNGGGKRGGKENQERIHTEGILQVMARAAASPSWVSSCFDSFGSLAEWASAMPRTEN